MKKNIMKKLSAFTAAVLMTSAIGYSAVTASAAGTTTGGVTTFNPITNAADDMTITATKEIVVFNENGSTVFIPQITYSYGIAPATEVTNKTITDSNGNTIKVSAGPSEGVVMGLDSTAAFNPDNTATVTASADGVTVPDPFTLQIDLSKFENSQTGVYRYILTETVDAADLNARGITRPSDYQNTRTLDVYIVKEETTNPETEEKTTVTKVAGYVLSIGSDNTKIDGKDTSNSVGFSGKTTGFVEEFHDEQGQTTADNPKYADQYYTYDYEVEKVITGNSTKTEKFPFTFTVTGTNGQKYYADTTAITIGTDAAPTADLGNGESFTLKGIPANASVAVQESNPFNNTYSVTIADTKATLTAQFSDTTNKLTPGSTASFMANKISAYTASTTPADDLKAKPNLVKTTFTNNLDVISPTGVVLMVAPYAIMLAAAMFFIAFFRRNKKREDANII